MNAAASVSTFMFYFQRCLLYVSLELSINHSNDMSLKIVVNQNTSNRSCFCSLHQFNQAIQLSEIGIFFEYLLSFVMKKLSKRNHIVFDTVKMVSSQNIDPVKVMNYSLSEFNRIKKLIPLNISYQQYSCKICGRNFDRKYNLARHKRVHQGKVENISCSECSKTFANKSNLKQHFIDVHPKKK